MASLNSRVVPRIPAGLAILRTGNTAQTRRASSYLKGLQQFPTNPGTLSAPTKRPAPTLVRSQFARRGYAGSRVADPRPESKKKGLKDDRGPTSKEDTQTDFGKLDVFGATSSPSTAVDVCLEDGFILDSGLRIGQSNGVILVGAEAFVWRPWMSLEQDAVQSSKVVNGDMLSKGRTEIERTGGVVNKIGQFETGPTAWGIFNSISPRPDLIIIGTGPTIRPLAPATRSYLQEIGMRIEVLDTRNAASQFNLLVTERGQYEVAAALLPIEFGKR